MLHFYFNIQFNKRAKAMKLQRLGLYVHIPRHAVPPGLSQQSQNCSGYMQKSVRNVKNNSSKPEKWQSTRTYPLI